MTKATHAWAKYPHNSLETVTICIFCNTQKSSLDLKMFMPCEGLGVIIRPHNQEAVE